MLEIFAYPAPYVAFFFMFLGILFRTVYPYIKKVKERQEENEILQLSGKTLLPTLKFDSTYALTFASDLLLAFMATMLFFNTWSPPDGTLFQVAVAAFVAGWGAQDLINRLV